MKRKQLSVYLSDDIYQYLVVYKDSHGLNNISMVIERIVLERIFRESGSLDMPDNLFYRPWLSSHVL